MARRIVTRFQRTSGFRAANGALGRWGAVCLLVAADLALVGLLLAAPGYWRQRQVRLAHRAWEDSLTLEPAELGKRLLATPSLSDRFPEDAEETRRLLADEPLLVAVLRRGRPGPVWVRTEAGFMDRPGSQGEPYRSWAQAAQTAGGPRWHPPQRLDPDYASTPSMVLVTSDWVFVKRWVVGSAEVERFLALGLGPAPHFRVGVAPVALDGGQPRTAWPALNPPLWQCSPFSSLAPWNLEFSASALGPGWKLVFQPWPATAAAMDRAALIQGRWVWVLAAAVMGSLGWGIWLRTLSRRRQKLDAGRLASILHSLKTPLAVHKMRCDSLRMGRLSPDRAAEELLVLGEDMLALTRIIERGMVALHPGAAPSEREALGPDWFEEVAEEFREVLAGLGRELSLELAPGSGLAHEPSLRSTLNTLLENACQHGQGQVQLRTWRHRGRLCIQVSDQGTGLDRLQMEALGQPFMRLREEGQEGFSTSGQGLGLSLCFQMARQEGWGLAMDSGSRRGLTFELQIP